jgi:UDP-N-acetylmuramoylalanine--D-glutamate ligase
MEIIMKIAVLGSGITGKAVKKRLAKEKEYQLTTDIQKADLIIASPGIPPAKYPKTKTPIINEIEFGARFLPKTKIVAITGTNGKTTTTTMISKILNCPAAGNIGTPLIAIADTSLKHLAVEVSSYQLETLKEFRPHISIILNITPDHMERHKTMAQYAKAKANIFKDQTKADFLIYNAKDPLIKKIIKNVKAKKIPLYPKTPLEQNSLAALAVAKICKVPAKKAEKVLKDFKGVEHRLEKTALKKGVTYVNDSKATNPESTIVALSAFKDPIILLAGGADKNTSLKELTKAMKNKVKLLVLFGEAKDRFAKAFKGFPVIEAKTLNNAVKIAHKHAVKNDIVLLSPACASFDMFKNFEERGNKFKKIVADLLKNK